MSVNPLKLLKVFKGALVGGSGAGVAIGMHQAGQLPDATAPDLVLVAWALSILFNAARKLLGKS